VLNAAGSAPVAGNASAHGMQHGHQGGRADAVTGLILFNEGGNGRYYSPTLGRWTGRDRHLDGPYVDGMNAYHYNGGNPINHLDPSGNYPFEQGIIDKLGEDGSIFGASTDAGHFCCSVSRCRANVAAAVAGCVGACTINCFAITRGKGWWACQRSCQSACTLAASAAYFGCKICPNP
jgi:RHS repeat-associated protein